MTTHFAQRCRERGITRTEPDKLRRELAGAIENYVPGEPNDAVEFVLAAGGASFWRFRVPEGVFYAVTIGPGCFPVTVYNQAMIRGKKAVERAKKRKKPFRKADPKGRMRPEKRRNGRDWRDFVG